jgi:apolipoprotein D and lipocalin family protein
MKSLKKIFHALISLLFIGCLGYPDNIRPVKDFELKKYLGKWYEIARLDHSFERGLEKVTAEYSMRGDGGVKVLNCGFSKEKKKWSEAEGKAYFVRKNDEGYLKVSFFGPFYGAYVIFELDDDYQYAFVTSSKKSYLWFLSRTPALSDELKAQFTKKAKELGFDTDALIWVDQE